MVAWQVVKRRLLTSWWFLLIIPWRGVRWSSSSSASSSSWFWFTRGIGSIGGKGRWSAWCGGGVMTGAPNSNMTPPMGGKMACRMRGWGWDWSWESSSSFRFESYLHKGQSDDNLRAGSMHSVWKQWIQGSAVTLILPSSDRQMQHSSGALFVVVVFFSVSVSVLASFTLCFCFSWRSCDSCLATQSSCDSCLTTQSSCDSCLTTKSSSSFRSR